MERTEAVAQLRYLAMLGRLIEKAAPTLKLKDATVEFFMVRYEGGIAVTYDEGTVAISTPDGVGGTNVMWLGEIDAGIEQYDRELAEGFEGEAPPIGGYDDASGEGN